MDLSEVVVRPVERGEEGRYQEQMQCHHYLGALPKIGETLWYVATYREEGGAGELFRRGLEMRGTRSVGSAGISATSTIASSSSPTTAAS